MISLVSNSNINTINQSNTTNLFSINNHSNSNNNTNNHFNVLMATGLVTSRRYLSNSHFLGKPKALCHDSRSQHPVSRSDSSSRNNPRHTHKMP